MNKGFYLKMSWGNIRKNRHIYLPYLMAVSLVVGLYYILCSLQMMVGASDMKGSHTMLTILKVCVPITGGFSLVILFYVNSFIMKQRKKEFGLYNILGMEKRHLARLMVTEVLLVAVISLVLGIFGGALLSQLVFLLFYKLIRMPVKLTMTIPLSAVSGTAELFGAGFALVMIYDVVSVLKTNPVRLLQEARQGEQEPKARWLLALVGVVTLGAGYWLAQSVENPMEALMLFFAAVLLVIIGTYCLFMAGSIALLKFLKKREHFYYKPSNFISISGMIYRMKQNAVGLASICILSTTVMATVGSCLGMFVGLEDGISKEYLRRVKITSSDRVDKNSTDPNEGKDPRPIMEKASRDYAAKYGLTVENEIGYSCYNNVFHPTDSGWEVVWGDYDNAPSYNELVYFQILTAEDFERNTGENLNLQEGEAAFNESEEGILGDSFEILGCSWKLQKTEQVMEVSTFMGMTSIEKSVQLILPSREALQSFQELYLKSYIKNYGLDDDSSFDIPVSYCYFFDVAGADEVPSSFFEGMRDAFDAVPHLVIVNNRDAVVEEYYQDYGTVVFVGLFLALIFLVATVLIIYYKQVTEGYDDRKRFQIMQNVGLSSREVKKTIQTQVLQVFFLPLGMAVLHIVMAFKSIVIMLSLFAVYDKELFALCIGATALVFALIYFLVYEITAKTYYKIVKM